MKFFLEILVLFVGFVIDSAQSKDRFEVGSEFEKCKKPLPFRKCFPFRTNTNWDDQRIKIVEEGFSGGFSQYKYTPSTEYRIEQLINFNIYHDGTFMKSVPGTIFLNNPIKGITDAFLPYRTTDEVLFFMSGIFTDCGTPPKAVGEQFDWRTSTLWNLRFEFRFAVVITWGEISCRNYDSLVLQTVDPFGRLLGNMFLRDFEPSLVTIIAQSIAGHIMTIACRIIEENGKTIQVLNDKYDKKETERREEVKLGTINKILKFVGKKPKPFKPPQKLEEQEDQGKLRQERLERRIGGRNEGGITKIKKFIGADIAGPLIDKKRYLMGIYSPKMKFLLTRTMAGKVILIYSNPGGSGTPLFDKAGVNIYINRKRNWIWNKIAGFNTPGSGFFLPGLAHHAFAAVLLSGMSINSTCRGFIWPNGPNDAVNLNVLYDHINNGEYSLPLDKCWPFCCSKNLDDVEKKQQNTVPNPA